MMNSIQFSSGTLSTGSLINIYLSIYIHYNVIRLYRGKYEVNTKYIGRSYNDNTM